MGRGSEGRQMVGSVFCSSRRMFIPEECQMKVIIMSENVVLVTGITSRIMGE